MHGRELRHSQNICASFTLLPFNALKRALECFGLRHVIHLESGQSVYIIGDIAEGATAFVYRVRDASGQVYAMKKVICQTKEQIHNVKHEMQIHRLFHHPNIMPILDHAKLSIGNLYKEFYLLFPFFENGTLRDRINIRLRKNEPFPEQWILTVFKKICDAVMQFHIRSPALAHRDIKPENILLSKEDEPILTDFGSVTEADVSITSYSEATMLQEVAAQMTSMAYRAPELYNVPSKSNISARTDGQIIDLYTLPNADT